MAKIKTSKWINVATATSPVNIQLKSQTEKYYIYGTKTLSANFVIQPTGTAKEGMSVIFDYRATVTTSASGSVYGDYEVLIFGGKVLYSQIAKKTLIICDYHNGAWTVTMFASLDTTSGAPTEGFGFDTISPTIVDNSTLAVDGTTKKLIIKSSGVTVTQLGADAVETAKIKAKNVTLPKLQDITRGSVIVGGASDAPSLVSLKATGAIPIGDGTDVNAIVPTGDVTITTAGVMAIGADKVVAAMVKDGDLTNTHINASAAIAYSKLNLAASIVNADIASGAVIAHNKMATLAASKILQSDGSGIVSVVDTATYPTLTELSYLKGVTSALQTQLAVKGGTSGTYTYSSTATIVLTVAATDYYKLNTTANAIAVTLPAANLFAAGRGIKITQVFSGGSDKVTVSPDGLDTLQGLLAADVASFTYSTSGESHTYVSNGTDTWLMFD